MSVGAAGTGRTTFVNTLCEAEVLQHKIIEGPETANMEAVLSIKPVNIGGFVFLRRDLFFQTKPRIVYRRTRGGRRSHFLDRCRYSWLWRQHRQRAHVRPIFFVYVLWSVTLMHFAASRRL